MRFYFRTLRHNNVERIAAEERETCVYSVVEHTHFSPAIRVVLTTVQHSLFCATHQTLAQGSSEQILFVILWVVVHAVYKYSRGE